MERKNRENFISAQTAITLIALVITIILLLILAGIVLSLILDKHGIIKQAQESGIEYTKAEIKEEIETAILAIHTGLIGNNIEGTLNNEVVINQLPQEIQQIIISSDMTGEYKGYEYWIDEEYKVHIGEKINNPIQVKIIADYVGTASTTIRVEATSTKGDIVNYKYEIDGKTVSELSKEICTIEELEPQTKYSITVMVTDDQGNRRRAIPITIITKKRNYIVKNGIWNVEKVLPNATMTSEGEYFKITVGSTEARGGFSFNYDLTNYKMIKADIEVIKKDMGSGSTSIGMGIMDKKLNILNDSSVKYITIVGNNETSKQRDVYKLDIQDFMGEYKVSCLKNATWPATSAIMHVYNVWLEE